VVRNELWNYGETFSSLILDESEGLVLRFFAQKSWSLLLLILINDYGLGLGVGCGFATNSFGDGSCDAFQPPPSALIN
jgi:hypothetical protein